jgi:hypothetical protein
LEDVWSLPDATPVLASSSLGSSLDKIGVACVTQTAVCTTEQAQAQAVLI